MQKIVCIDIETTGTNRKIDSIVQISAERIIMNDDGSITHTGEEYDSYVNPGPDAHLTPQAMEKTGIIPETVADAPSSDYVMREFREWIKDDDDILTYNGNTFDLPFIKKEMKLAGLDFPLNGRKCYDGLYLESQICSRKLEEVYKRYNGGREMKDDGLDAHNSLSDVKATINVFQKQMNIIREKEIPIETGNTCGGMIGKDDTGRRVFLVGKHRGEPIREIIASDPSYITWFIKDTADMDVYAVLKEEYTSYHNELKSKSMS